MSSFVRVTEDDDLDVCLYYLRTVSNVLRWAPDNVWSILDTTAVPDDSGRPEVQKMS